MNRYPMVGHELHGEMIATMIDSLRLPALRGAVRAATGAQGDTELTLGELLQVNGATSQLAQLGWLTEQRTTASRTLLVQALANSYAAGSQEAAKLGVDAELKMLPGDWGIWLLREIKALEALATPDAVEQPAEADA